MTSTKSIPIKRVLITGGAGFIGSHVVDAYINAGLDVTVVDNMSQGRRENLHPKATLYTADINDLSQMKKILDRTRPQLLNLHAAHVNVRFSQDDPLFDAHQNIIGLLTVLQAARQAPLQKIIFASSGGAVYGNQQLPLTENSPTAPTSPYGTSKRAGELYVQTFSKLMGIPYLALRYGNVYGARQNHSTGSGIIGMLIEAVLTNTPITIYGDGSHTRDYIHVEDVAHANISAIHTTYSGVVNIGTGVKTSISDLINHISSVMNRTPTVIYAPKRNEEQHDCELDTQLAKRELQWNALINLDTGIQKTIDSYFTAKRHAS